MFPQEPQGNDVSCATELVTFNTPVQINDQDMTVVVASFAMNQDISGECARRETGKGRLQWAAAAPVDHRPTHHYCKAKNNIMFIMIIASAVFIPKNVKLSTNVSKSSAIDHDK